LQFLTIDHWDEDLWKKASIVYIQAFGKGGKPEKIIRNMFDKKLCKLHLLMIDKQVIGMAISGIISKANALLIDYLAVHTDYQNQGIGSQLLTSIKYWAASIGIGAIIIEVESEANELNLKRIQFWKQNDFSLTEYIHHYIWVPEPYLAMYCKLTPSAKLSTNGEILFQFINQFHKESFKL
jgi:GNAT superfamily N-acetyltransferase